MEEENQEVEERLYSIFTRSPIAAFALGTFVGALTGPICGPYNINTDGDFLILGISSGMAIQLRKYPSLKNRLSSGVAAGAGTIFGNGLYKIISNM
jgi:uncharacterized membrane protein